MLCVPIYRDFAAFNLRSNLRPGVGLNVVNPNTRLNEPVN